MSGGLTWIMDEIEKEERLKNEELAKTTDNTVSEDKGEQLQATQHIICETENVTFRVASEDIKLSWVKESVNHPAHYGGEDDPYEAIKVIEAWKLGFCDGNVIKYLSRWRSKGGIQDLKKAKWYLDRFIQQEEKLKGEI